MAAYGAQIEQGKSPEEALDFLKARPQEHAGAGQVGPRVARDLQRRQGRRADLLRERGDHRAEGRRGARLRDPGRDDPDPEPGRGDREGQVARRRPKAFLDFLKTDEAQKIYAAKGYRTSRPRLVDKSTYPDPKKLFKIDKFGGWDKVNADFFDPDTGSVAKIEQELGVSTAK